MMILNRQLSAPDDSFFLFGPRDVGAQRVFDQTHGKGRFIGYYETGAGSEVDFVIEVRKRTLTKRPVVVAIEVKSARRWDLKWERAIRDLEASGKVEVAGE